MAYRSLRRGARRAPRGKSQRKYTWVIVGVPPQAVPPATSSFFELLTPVRPPGTVTQEVYQNMTNPTVIAVYGNVTVFADRDLDCDTSNATNVTYAWGIYKDTDIFAPATAPPPFSSGQSNLWMMHHTGFLLIPGQIDCTGFPNNLGVNDLQYRRYELSQRRYKRRLDSQNDTLVFAVENAPPPFSGTNGELVVSAYFRILLLE